MKPFSFTLLFLLFIFNLIAQNPFEVQFSSDQILPVDIYIARDRNYYLDGENICVVDAKGYKQELKDIYVSRFDKNTLKFISNTFIFPKGSFDKSFMEMSYENIVVLNGNYYILIKNIDRKSEKITYYSIPLDQHFNPTEQPTLVLDISHEKGFGTTSVLENKEHDGFLMLFNNTTAKGDEKGKMFYTIMDNNFKTVKEGSVQLWDKTGWLGWTSDVYAVLSVRRGPSNILYDVAEDYKNDEYASKHSFAVTMADMNTGKTLTLNIDQVENPVSASLYADDNNIYVYGYCRSEKNEGADALYIITISREDMTIKEKQEIQFDSNTISQLFYTKSKNSNYRMYGANNVDFYKTSDGGAYIIGEQYEQYSVSTDNGSYSVHCGGNIIVIKIDAAGDKEWISTIPRRNMSKAYRLSNIYTKLVNDELIFFYNDIIDNIDATTVNDLKVAHLSSDPEKMQLVGVAMDSKGSFEKMALGDAQLNNGLYVYPDEIVEWNHEENTWICRVNHFILKKYWQVSMMKVTYKK